VRAGDEAAFELLVWRHGPMVLGACRRVLRHEQDAEDAFQATFLVLARNAGAIGKSASLAGWLYTVAYRVALRARQRRAARGRPAALAAGATVADARPGPADLAAAREDRPQLEAEVARLPEKYRAAFVLCCLESKTTTEAAEVLGCPRGTVLSRLARAREQLRRRLSGRRVAPAALPLATLLAEYTRPVADVSPVLVTGAAHLARLVAAGQAPAGDASPTALALANGALLSAGPAGLIKVSVVLAVVAAAGAAVAVLAYAPAPPAVAPCHGSAAAPTCPTGPSPGPLAAP
jgi:RNA polymerase sigma factor (sigma-70 family)